MERTAASSDATTNVQWYLLSSYDHDARVTWITGGCRWPRQHYLLPHDHRSHSVSLGMVQMRCTTDPEENLEKAIARRPRGRRRGAQIVCLQELFRSQYFCQTEDHAHFELAEPIPGPSTERAVRAAPRSSAW